MSSRISAGPIKLAGDAVVTTAQAAVLVSGTHIATTATRAAMISTNNPWP